MSTVELPSIFGPIVTAADVEGWTLETLRLWFPTYLSEVERSRGIEACTLPRPRGWSLGPTFDKWPEDQVPAVMVTSTGTVDPPRKEGNGSYRARWGIEPSVLCSAASQAGAHELAALYGAAIRLVMLQKPSLGGNAAGTVWLGERYDDLDYDDTRSLYAVRNVFVVEVEDVAWANAGPGGYEPPPDPCMDPGPWPLVETVDIDVDNVTVDSPLEEEDS